MSTPLCETCELALIAGTAELDPVLADHLAHCRTCREFADFQRQVLAAAPVVPERLPEWAEIRAAATARRLQRTRRLRLIVWPLSLAAVALLTVVGFFFRIEPAAAPADPIRPGTSVLAANWSSDSTEISAELLEATVRLAWDSASADETQCRDSLAAARGGNAAWNIEVFNPVSEDL